MTQIFRPETVIEAEQVRVKYPTTWYWADCSFVAKTVSVDADRYIINTPNYIQVDIGGSSYTLTAQTTINLSTATNWGRNVADRANSTAYSLGDVIPTPSTSAYYWECTTAGTSASSDPGSWGTAVGNTKTDGDVVWTARFANPTTAASRAGKDFYVYACQPASGTVPLLKLSPNATTPYGYSESNSRKLAGFHCLCVAAGTISGHSLTGYLAGDILPLSVWDLKFRATPCGNEGMSYDVKDDEWKDIYPASSSGATTASVYYTATAATVSRNWMDVVDDGLAIGKHLLRDAGFQSGAAGSNEETQISTGAFPAGTGGYSDTAGRRMISNIGLESCCGHVWQWLDEQSTRWDFTTGWDWYDLPGSKGSLFNGAGAAGTGDVKLIAGGSWGDGSGCGSRSRNADGYRWYANAAIGGRFAARSIKR